MLGIASLVTRLLCAVSKGHSPALPFGTAQGSSRVEGSLQSDARVDPGQRKVGQQVSYD